jgi:hypothetical protein
MTAIDKFIRLEAIGWWFEAGRQEAREVVVSFGDATLQISSLKDVPLTHWSLLATKRVGTRGEAVIYSADPEQHEVLEIEDPEMIRAISAITSALVAPEPAPKWRRSARRGLGLALLAGLLWAAPPLIYRATTLLTPPARMAALSDDMADGLRQAYGEECKGWRGARALAAFSAQLQPDYPLTLLVFARQDTPAIALPNGVALSEAAVKAATPESLAALVISRWAMGQNRKPLAAYIRTLGPVGALHSLISGRFPKGAKPATIAPDGADYLLARDYLQAHGLSAFQLQQMAKADGIGLPLGPVIADSHEFRFEDFETLQNICAEQTH